MDQPIDLSVVEIRNYMLRNDGKVTNHALVKHFKKFLTNSHTQNEARKRFKTYVTLLSTIKNENNQKFLILRKKYINECPSVEAIEAAISTVEPCSPGDSSLISEFSPCRPPPEQTSAKETVHQDQNENYRDCVNKFSESMQRNGFQPCIDYVDSSKNNSVFSRNPLDEAITAENISRFSFSSEASSDSSATDKVSGAELGADESENPISVKEATRKFNRMASEEEARIISPSAKKKQEKQLIEEKDSTEVTMAHPKAKEWIVSMAKANYQELAKLAGEFPELVKLQGYTALHWAAKHGNEDVVKLIAGTFKADVNSKTNGGYTPLHLATQFGRDNIFELLWNVYKANRDIMDWNGNKPLDYSQQRPSISASTCSSEYQKFFLSTEINNNYRLGGLNSASPFSTGASEYSGGTLGSALTRGKKRSQMRYATISGANSGGILARSQSVMTHQSNVRFRKQSAQSLFKHQIKDDNLVPGDIVSQSKATNHPSDLSSEEDSGDLRRVSTKRKESFLRKTFRSAAGASRPSKDVVTNPSLKL